MDIDTPPPDPNDPTTTEPTNPDPTDALLAAADATPAEDPQQQQPQQPLTAEDELLQLEDRLVDDLDQFKLSPTASTDVQLQLLLEICAYSSGALSKKYYPLASDVGVDVMNHQKKQQVMFENEVYERLNEDIALPTMVEIAQSDAKISRRCSALAFFHKFYRAYFVSADVNLNIGSSSSSNAMRGSRSNTVKLNNFLNYWVQASIGCLVDGMFTQSSSESAVKTKGVLSANAAIRPVMRSIAQCIAVADDAGAMALFEPCMNMISAVYRILFTSGEMMSSNNSNDDDNLRSSCIKFIETVVLCFSIKDTSGHKKRGGRSSEKKEEFSLTDLPTGHPVITRDILESIGHYAFVALRGLVYIGGQVVPSTSVMLTSEEMKHEGFIQDMLRTLKPASLSFLEVESSYSGNDDVETKINRKDLDISFILFQKSYAIALNAISIIAINRPLKFKDAASVLARRTIDPPSAAASSEDGLSKSAAMGVNSQLRATCLTLLRNPLSITSKASDILVKALKHVGMTVQAEKARNVAKQQAALKTASRKVRNRAAVFYEWDQSEQERTSKRQRETDDALAKMRAAKVARGLGNGIHLPSNLIETCELVLLNLRNMPATRPPSSKKNRGVVNFDYINDAIMSNGASLKRDAGRWYDRDGGIAWSMDIIQSSFSEPGAQFELSSKALAEKSGRELYAAQCAEAGADAFNRVVSFDEQHGTQPAVISLRQQLSSRLAWIMKGVKPSSKQPDLLAAHNLALQSVDGLNTLISESAKEDLKGLIKDYPLVAACLVMEYAKHPSTLLFNDTDESSSTALVQQILSRAYLQDTFKEIDSNQKHADQTVDLFLSCISHVCSTANKKPTDLDNKRLASLAQKSFPNIISGASNMSERSFKLLSSICNIEDVHKNLGDITKRSSSTIAASAAAHAATAAAEKRATTTLLSLRDIAFERTKTSTRQAAVDCAVALATGHYPCPKSIQDKALKLVMNLLFPKSEILADMVVSSATNELNRITDLAIENSKLIESEQSESSETLSEAEENIIAKIKPITELYMALCVRRPEAIKTLMLCSCRENANVLQKTVKSGISKMAKATATAYGAASIARRVSNMAGPNEKSILLAFLDNLSPRTGAKDLPDTSLVDACFEIQTEKEVNGRKDPRFIIPVVSALPRSKLVGYLPTFISENDDDVYKSALLRMSEKLTRENFEFRIVTDQNPETSFKGMTRCEQLVFLHRLDFKAVGLPQKRYLDSIKTCLDMDEIFTDRILHAALDYISHQFLLEKATLPLAYMRTIIIVCQKHETLHNYFCSDLLPRLIEGKIYNDRRQWEGWMRAARMLEKNIGVNSLEAIAKLPAEQLKMYRSKNPE